MCATAGLADETVMVWAMGRGPKASSFLYRGLDVSSLLSPALTYHRLLPGWPGAGEAAHQSSEARQTREAAHPGGRQRGIGGAVVAVRGDAAQIVVGTPFGGVLTVELPSGVESAVVAGVPAGQGGGGGVGGVAYSPGPGRWVGAEEGRWGGDCPV